MKKRGVIIIGIVLVVVFIVLSFIVTYSTIQSRKLSKDNSKSETFVNAVENAVNLVSDDNVIVVEMSNEIEENKFNEVNSDYDYSELENEDTSTEMFDNYYGQAMEILKTMTLSEKVGQLFLVRYPDGDANVQIKEENPGGYLLFGKDFKNENTTSIINKLTENQNNSKVKMLVAVDEEGGDVVRVSYYSQFRDSKFKSLQELDQEGGIERIIEDSHEKSKLLKSLGINYNLAPVADVSTNENSFMYSRALGKNADETALYIREIVKTMNEDKMLSALKHFPGYGENEDTHTGIAIDERDITEFEENDLKPFALGIEAKAPTILVSHNIVKSMDENLPASLSPNVHRVLKEDLNYSGLIITDDLAMGAVKDYVENGGSAVQAVIAGNDLIISSDFKNQKREVLDAVKEGVISEDTINRTVRKILACKIAYEIIK